MTDDDLGQTADELVACRADPTEWREFEDWLALATACRFEGIGCEDFVAWSVSDPQYAGHAELIRRKWSGLTPVHGGALWAALSRAGVKFGQTEQNAPGVRVPLTLEPTRNVGARLSNICVGFRHNPTEPNLFSWSCLMAEVLRECRLGPPRKYHGLMESAAMGTPLWGDVRS